MKTLTLNAWEQDYQAFFHTDHYANNGNLYVGIAFFDEDGQPAPWSDLTVNLDVKCADDCAFIDTNNNSDRIVEWLITHQLGWLTGNMRSSGFCMYPEFQFNMEKLKEYMEEL